MASVTRDVEHEAYESGAGDSLLSDRLRAETLVSEYSYKKHLGMREGFIQEGYKRALCTL